MDKLQEALKKYAEYVVKKAKENLAKGGKFGSYDKSGALSRSLGYKINKGKLVKNYEDIGNFDKGNMFGNGRQIRYKIVNDKLKIIIRNLNPKKRPISAVADNIEVRNAKSITVKTNQKIKFHLLYDKNRSLQKKIKVEQLRKEIF